jgi:transposase
MRKKMPTITASADELQQRMRREKDGTKRQRLQALYVAASGQAAHRQEIAALLGVHRHSVAGWFAAYTAGGIEQALRYQVPRPTVPRRLTDPALTALKATLEEPAGCAKYNDIRTWLAAQHHVHLSYASVYALVRGELRAKPKRPRPSQEKQARTPCPSFTRLCPPSSHATV